LTLTILAILFFGGGLLAVICATAISSVVVFTIYFLVVRRMLPTWRPAFQVNWTLLRSLVAFSFFLFLSKISQSFAIYFMQFIISAMLGPSAVTYYSVPLKIISAFGGFLSASAGALFPFASEMNAQGAREALRRVYLLASKCFVSVAVPVFTLMGLFSWEILSLWMGSDFAHRATIPMMILCSGTVISSTSTVSGVVMLGIGRSRLLAGFSLVSMALAASLAVPLIRAADISGAATAYLVGCVVWIVFQCYVARSLFGLAVSAYFNQVYRFHALAMVPLVAAALLCQYFLGSRSAFTAVAGGGILLSGYYGVSVLSKWTDVAELRRLVGVKAG
jgi:O-antigen/teichoic acid export membrane protein